MKQKKEWRGILGLVCLYLVCLIIVVVGLSAQPILVSAGAGGQLLFSRQVTINGKDVVSGQTVFDGNRIKVGVGGLAVVGLGKQGRFELGEKSEMNLLVSGNNIGGMLVAGCLAMNVSAEGNVMVELPNSIVSSAGKQSSSFTAQVKDGTVFIYSALGDVKVTTGGKSEIIGNGEAIAVKSEVAGGNSLQQFVKKESLKAVVPCSCDSVTVFVTDGLPKVQNNPAPSSVGLLDLLLNAWMDSKAFLFGSEARKTDVNPRANGSGLTCLNTDGVFCKPAGPVTP